MEVAGAGFCCFGWANHIRPLHTEKSEAAVFGSDLKSCQGGGRNVDRFPTLPDLDIALYRSQGAIFVLLIKFNKYPGFGHVLLFPYKILQLSYPPFFSPPPSSDSLPPPHVLLSERQDPAMQLAPPRPTGSNKKLGRVASKAGKRVQLCGMVRVAQARGYMDSILRCNPVIVTARRRGTEPISHRSVSVPELLSNPASLRKSRDCESSHSANPEFSLRTHDLSIQCSNKPD